MYNLIVARNNFNGIGVIKNTRHGIYNSIPWKSDRTDMQFFVNKTIGNVVIMGRKTWESLPTKPLKDRINIILTSNPDYLTNSSNIFIFSSIEKCDTFLNKHNLFHDTDEYSRWVIGGERVYNEYMEKELINNVYITQFNSNEQCDTHFNWFNGNLHGFTECLDENLPMSTRFKIFHFTKQNYEEMKLLSVMNEIVTSGHVQPNRTGTNTHVLFGKMFEYIMKEKIDKDGNSIYRLPLLTTKKMFTRGIFEELKWFLNGSVDSKELENKKINIWKENTSRKYLDRINLNDYEEGETGPIYGFQWKHWGASYIPGKKDYGTEGIDQVNKVIHSLTNDPFSRRHVISAWNVEDLDKMCLPPCFVAGTLVLTNNGYKCIEMIKDDDLVFTHKSNWKPIVNKQVRLYTGNIVRIKHICNSRVIVATEEHPFLVKLLIKKEVNGHATYSLSGRTKWVKAKDLSVNEHVLCIPVINKEQPLELNISINNKTVNSINIDYFTIGYYVGDKDSFTNMKYIPSGWSILQEFTKNNEYSDFIQCDMIPEWVQDLPKDDLFNFIKGFETASASQGNKFLHSVSNYIIALALQRIYIKLNVITNIFKIEHNYFILKVTGDTRFHYRDSKYMYVPLISIEHDTLTEPVYNLEVADDNSYVVENIATHNCHVLYQFFVHEENNQKYLSLMMTQRSCDTFLGLPFNLCSLGIFLFLMSQHVIMKPYKIIHSIGDMHVYNTHLEAVKKQVTRTPYEFPYIKLLNKKDQLEDYEYTDIKIVNYFSHDTIKVNMNA